MTDTKVAFICTLLPDDAAKTWIINGVKKPVPEQKQSVYERVTLIKEWVTDPSVVYVIKTCYTKKDGTQFEEVQYGLKGNVGTPFGKHINRAGRYCFPNGYKVEFLYGEGIYNIE